MDGIIDEVTLYNRALTLAEIEEHYNIGNAGNHVPIYAAGDHMSSDWEVYIRDAYSVPDSIRRLWGRYGDPNNLTQLQISHKLPPARDHWVRVRYRDINHCVSEWSEPVKFTTEGFRDIVINEINYATDNNQPDSMAGHEYVEIYNSDRPEILDGWQLRNRTGVLYEFPSGSEAIRLPRDSLLVVISGSAQGKIAEDRDLSDGSGRLIASGTWESNALSDGGDSIGLFSAPEQNIVTLADFVSYDQADAESDPSADDLAVSVGIWSEGAAVDSLTAGTSRGRALYLVADGQTPHEALGGDAEDLDWDQYPADIRGSPGRRNSPIPQPPAGARNIVINEINFAADDHAPLPELRFEYVELYNRGSAAVTLDGWQLRDCFDQLYNFPLGSETMAMPPGSHLVIFSHAAQGVIAEDRDLSDGAGRLVAGSSWGSSDLVNSGDSLKLFTAFSPLTEATLADFVSYAENNAEAAPSVDDIAVRAGIWSDGAAVDTLSASACVGRSIYLKTDGYSPNEAAGGDLEDLDWSQYDEATGGSPGSDNAAPPLPPPSPTPSLAPTPAAASSPTVTPTAAPTPRAVSEPVEDAYVDQKDPTTIFGITDPSNLGLGWVNGNAQRVFLKFDLSAIIPGEAEVVSAKLILHNEKAISVPNFQAVVYGITDDTWSENAICWNNRLDFGYNALAVQTLASAGKVSWEVTAYVQAEQEGDRTASFCLKDSLEWGADPRRAEFYSKDNPDAAYRPRLEIIFALPTPTPSPAPTPTPDPFRTPISRGIAINEIKFAPDSIYATGEPKYEYVELYNRGPFPIALDGWRLRDESEELFAFPSGLEGVTLPPETYLVVFSGAAQGFLPEDRNFDDGAGRLIAGSNWSAYDLVNTGDSIQIYSGSNLSVDTLVDFVSYDQDNLEDDPSMDDLAVAAGIWTDAAAVDTLTAASSVGQGIYLIEDGNSCHEALGSNQEDLDWDQYDLDVGGSPGMSNLPSSVPPEGYRDIVINELNFAADSEAVRPELRYEYVELYNRGDIAVALDGWCLKDNLGVIYYFPRGAQAISIPPHGLVVVFQQSAAAAFAEDRDLSDGDGRLIAGQSWNVHKLANTGDCVQLYITPIFNPDTIADYVSFNPDDAESDPSMDDMAVSAGIWGDGAAIGTESAPNSVGRAMYLKIDGHSPHEAAGEDLEDLDWDQYSVENGGSPGELNIVPPYVTPSPAPSPTPSPVPTATSTLPPPATPTPTPQPTPTIAPTPRLSLTPVADSYIAQDSPDANYGILTQLSVKGRDAKNERVLLKFDLHVLPANAYITSASLKLSCYEGEALGSDFNLELHGLNDDSWTETEVVWNNQPAAEELLGSMPSESLGEKTWDIRDFVQAEQAQDRIAGFAIKASAANESGTLARIAHFYSKEYNAAPDYPRLDLTYILIFPSPSPSPIPTPTPLIYYVDPGAAPGGDGQSWESAFRSLQEAMDAIPDETEVWCADGQVGGAVIRRAADIYGGFAGNEVVRGQRNWTLNRCALGSVRVADGARARFDGVEFHLAAPYAGIHFEWGNHGSELRNCVLSNCSSGYELIGFHSGQGLALINCFFHDNSTEGFPLLSFQGCSDLRIVNCTIASNITNSSGAICSFDGSGGEVSNTILWNSGENEIIADQTEGLTVSYCDIDGGYPGFGNLQADPAFVGPTSQSFHLRPDSPCVDAGIQAGAPGTDWDNETRPMGTGIDIGADEVFFPPTPTPLPSPSASPVLAKSPTPSPSAIPTPSAVPTVPPSPSPSATSTPLPSPTPIRLIVDADDYDGDGSSDFALWRGYDGSWRVLDITLVYYGKDGDVPITGDYNGDGTADLALFRPSSGQWLLRNPAGGSLWNSSYGQKGDIPVPADYDGDFRSDTAVWRPATGRWYIRGQSTFVYGLDGDLPAPGDYNGDGIADAAVYRSLPGGSVWYVRNITSIFCGQIGDCPVAGDYNGDGTTEYSVFSPSIGRWHIVGAGYVAFGQSGDIAFPMDYDGCGTADRAIFRPSEGKWYIYSKTSALFGTQNDQPSVGASY